MKSNHGAIEFEINRLQELCKAKIERCPLVHCYARCIALAVRRVAQVMVSFALACYCFAMLVVENVSSFLRRKDRYVVVIEDEYWEEAARRKIILTMDEASMSTDGVESRRYAISRYAYVDVSRNEAEDAKDESDELRLAQAASRPFGLSLTRLLRRFLDRSVS